LLVTIAPINKSPGFGLLFSQTPHISDHKGELREAQLVLSGEDLFLMNEQQKRYRDLPTAELLGSLWRACVILVMLFSFLGSTFAHAHGAQDFPAAPSSEQFSGSPDKSKNPFAKHDAICCACVASSLPRTRLNCVPLLEADSVKYSLDRGFSLRATQAWTLDPPPRT